MLAMHVIKMLSTSPRYDMHMRACLLVLVSRFSFAFSMYPMTRGVSSFCLPEENFFSCVHGPKAQYQELWKEPEQLASMLVTTGLQATVVPKANWVGEEIVMMRTEIADFAGSFRMCLT